MDSIQRSDQRKRETNRHRRKIIQCVKDKIMEGCEHYKWTVPTTVAFAIRFKDYCTINIHNCAEKRDQEEHFGPEKLKGVSLSSMGITSRNVAEFDKNASNRYLKMELISDGLSQQLKDREFIHECIDKIITLLDTCKQDSGYYPTEFPDKSKLTDCIMETFHKVRSDLPIDIYMFLADGGAQRTAIDVSNLIPKYNKNPDSVSIPEMWGYALTTFYEGDTDSIVGYEKRPGFDDDYYIRLVKDDIA